MMPWFPKSMRIWERFVLRGFADIAAAVVVGRADGIKGKPSLIGESHTCESAPAPVRCRGALLSV